MTCTSLISEESPMRGLRTDTRVTTPPEPGTLASRVNHKRIHRIMRTFTTLTEYSGRPARLHTGTIIKQPHQQYTVVFRWFEKLCFNGDKIRVAFAMDCSDREVMSEHNYDKRDYRRDGRDLMAESIEYRFGNADRVPHKIQWLTDNGSADTA